MAVFEAAKGLLMLIAAFGFLRYADHNTRELVEEAMAHLHFNPAHQRYGAILKALDRLDDVDTRLIALAALCYTAFRLIEAYGLWKKRPWGEIVVMLSTGVYIPLELYEIFDHFTLLKLAITVGNLAIFAYVIYAFRKQRASVNARASGSALASGEKSGDA